MEVGGSPWLAFTISVIGLVTALVTAVFTVGPVIIERRKSRPTTVESSESALIGQVVGDAVKLIESAIDDLRDRVGRLETMRMTDVHDQHG